MLVRHKCSLLVAVCLSVDSHKNGKVPSVHVCVSVASVSYLDSRGCVSFTRLSVLARVRMILLKLVLNVLNNSSGNL